MEIQQHVFVLNRLGRIVTHIFLPNFLCSTKHQPITPGFEDRTGPKETLLCRVSRVANKSIFFFSNKHAAKRETLWAREARGRKLQDGSSGRGGRGEGCNCSIQQEAVDLQSEPRALCARAHHYLILRR